EVTSSAATVSPSCLMMLVCATVDLCLTRGINDAWCIALAHLGYIAAWHLHDYDSAFRFGELGYELVERRGLYRFEGMVCLSVSTLIMPWARHVTQCRSMIRRTFDVAHNTGNRFLAVANGNVLLSNLLLAGDPLGDVAREAENCLALCRTGTYS